MKADFDSFFAEMLAGGAPTQDGIQNWGDLRKEREDLVGPKRDLTEMVFVIEEQKVMTG